jgi:hypothetical protein
MNVEMLIKVANRKFTRTSAHTCTKYSIFFKNRFIVRSVDSVPKAFHQTFFCLLSHITQKVYVIRRTLCAHIKYKDIHMDSFLEFFENVYNI